MDKMQLMQVATGRVRAELVFKNAQILDVLAGRIFVGDVAVSAGIIVGIGSGYFGETELDCTGKYLAPGFINCHCHIESVMVTPDCYAMEEIKNGTTTIITDPHEIANVAGTAGLDYMLSYRGRLPLDYYVQLPSCVPATPLEHSGAVLHAQALAPYVGRPGVLGLGEMMNVPGVLGGDADVYAKLRLFADGVIDGHSPSLMGHSLDGYILSGVSTDHESSSFEEAVEKVSKGLSVLVREGSASKNLQNILTPFIQQGLDTTNLAFCTDDKHLADIVREGTISHCIRLAIALGLPPIKAIQMATINGTRAYGLHHRGAIAPGYAADLVLLDNLEQVRISRVYKDGLLRCQDGQYLGPVQQPLEGSRRIAHSVILPPLTEQSFCQQKATTLSVINMLPGEILTRREDISYEQAEQELQTGELCKLASIERHGGSGGIGVGLLRGYGLRHGAIAGTVAHDSHNMLVAGDNDVDMLLAARAVERLQGGYALVQQGRVVQELPLPIAGLMSPLPTEALSASIEAMVKAIRGAGVGHGVDPLTTLSFMALPVIPEIRITDRGMFDVRTGEFVL